MVIFRISEDQNRFHTGRLVLMPTPVLLSEPTLFSIIVYLISLAPMLYSIYKIPILFNELKTNITKLKSKGENHE